MQLQHRQANLVMPRGKHYPMIDPMDNGKNRFPTSPQALASLFPRGMADTLLGNERSAFTGVVKEFYDQYPENLKTRVGPLMDRK